MKRYYGLIAAIGGLFLFGGLIVLMYKKEKYNPISLKYGTSHIANKYKRKRIRRL